MIVGSTPVESSPFPAIELRPRFESSAAASRRSNTRSHDTTSKTCSPNDGQWRSSLREHLAEEMKTAGAVAISDYGYGCVQTEVLQGLSNESGPPPWLCLDSRYRIGSFTGIDGATPNLEELEAHCGRRLQERCRRGRRR